MSLSLSGPCYFIARISLAIYLVLAIALAVAQTSQPRQTPAPTGRAPAPSAGAPAPAAGAPAPAAGGSAHIDSVAVFPQAVAQTTTQIASTQILF